MHLVENPLRTRFQKKEISGRNKFVFLSGLASKDLCAVRLNEHFAWFGGEGGGRRLSPLKILFIKTGVSPGSRAG